MLSTEERASRDPRSRAELWVSVREQANEEYVLTGREYECIPYSLKQRVVLGGADPRTLNWLPIHVGKLNKADANLRAVVTFVVFHQS